MTESEDEFDRIRDAFDEELKPRGIVEQMYVTDIAYLSGKFCGCGAARRPSSIPRCVLP